MHIVRTKVLLRERQRNHSRKVKNEKKWFIFGFAFLCIVLCYKSQVVSFYDKEFERAVRELMLSDCVSILIRREKPIRGPILRSNVKDVEDIFY